MPPNPWPHLFLPLRATAVNISICDCVGGSPITHWRKLLTNEANDASIMTNPIKEKITKNITEDNIFPITIINAKNTNILLNFNF